MAIKRVSASYARGLPAVTTARRTVRLTGGRATHAQPAAERPTEVDADTKTETGLDANLDASSTLRHIADFSSFRTNAVAPGERIAPVDYHAIIAGAVSGVANSTAEARHAIYECARQVVIQRLGAIRPALPPELMKLEQLSLDVAVAKIEADAVARQAETETPTAPTAPRALAPVVIDERQRNLPQARQFHGGTVRVFGAMAIIIAGLFGYWLIAGRPELPSPHSLARLLPAGQGQGGQIADPPAASRPNAPTEPDPAALQAGAVAATNPMEFPPSCAAATDPDERVLCAFATFAVGDGWFADTTAEPQLPYWMTLSYRVAIATFVAREGDSSIASAPEPAPQAAPPPAVADGTRNPHLEAGRALAAAHNLQGAIREFSEAIRIDPQSAAAYVERGQVRFKNGSPERAIEDFESATQIDPQHAAAFKALGMAVHYLGDADRAIASLSKAIQITEADPSRLPAIDVFFARRVRATLHHGKQQIDAELADLGAIIDGYWKNPALAVELRANYGEPGAAGVMAQVYRARAAILTARRDYDGATADLSLAMHVDPRQTLALTIERGHVQEQAGRRAQAEADFKRALKLSPGNDNVKSALARLRGGA